MGYSCPGPGSSAGDVRTGSVCAETVTGLCTGRGKALVKLYEKRNNFSAYVVKTYRQENKIWIIIIKYALSGSVRHLFFNAF